MRRILLSALCVLAGVLGAQSAWADCQQLGSVVTCTGTDPDGFGDGTQNNLTVNVLSGATVFGSPAGIGINLNDNNAVNNAGTVSVGTDSGVGIFVNNNSSIFNTGTVNESGQSAIGIFGVFNTIVVNSGTITTFNDFGTGVLVLDGSTVTNNGAIAAGATGIGISAAGTGITAVNNGTITIGSGNGATGIQDSGGNNVFKNFGTITVGDDGAGISTLDGTSVLNAGTINVGNQVTNAFTAGIVIADNETVINSGAINAGTNAQGIVLVGNNNTVTNSGSIAVGPNVGGAFNAIGISVFGMMNNITNSSSIRTGANAIGILLGGVGAPIPTGNHTINNSGSVVAGADGFSILSESDANTIGNTGTLDGRIDLTGTANELTNAGLITITDPGTAMAVTDTIGGNFTQTGAGTLALRVDATPSHDTFAVSGTATPGGTLRALVQPGLYGTTTNYLGVLTAGNAIGTQFAQVNASSAFFTAAATYNANSVDLTLTRLAFGGAPGETPNQSAVGRALDSLYSTGLTGAAATFFGNLLTANSVGALDALSGEGTAATQNTAFSAGDQFMDALMRQFWLWQNGGRDGVADGAAEPLGYASVRREPAAFAAMHKPAPVQVPSWHAWASGFGGRQSFDADSKTGAAAASDRSAGGAAGLDYQANPDLLLGFGAGGSGSRFSVPDRATSGHVDGAHVGVYAMGRWGAAYAAALVSYGRYDNDTTRTIAGIGPTVTATGSFASDQLGARLEVGRSFDYGKVAITPFAALQVSELWQRGYDESTNGGAVGLSYAPVTVTSLPSFVGAQVATRVQLESGAVWAPFLRGAWVHEFEPKRQITASFLTLPGASFAVDGARPASGSFALDIGSQLTLNATTALTASFTGDFAGGTRSYGGSGGFVARF